MGVRHMFVREHSKGDRSQENQGNRHDPRKGEPFSDQRGLSVEVAPTGQKRAEHDRQDNRLRVIESFKQREQNSCAQKNPRQEVGAVKPLLEAPGQEQKYDTGEASKEVGDLKNRKGEDVS